MALDDLYQERRQTLAVNSRRASGRIWVARDWEDPDDIVVKSLIRLTEGAMRQAVNLQNAYFSEIVRALVGDPQLKVPIVGPSKYTVELVRGVSAIEVYSRLFGALAKKLADGLDFIAADRAAAKYAEKLTATDLQLAQTHSAKDWMESAPSEGGIPEIVGYRRIWEGGCEYCRVACQRLYHISTLMPIHENCGCGIAPVFEGESIDLPFHPVETGADDSTVGNRLSQSGPIPDTANAGE